MSDAPRDDLLTVVQRRAEESPRRTALSWLATFDADPLPVSRAELVATAWGVAGAIRARTAPGDRVLLSTRPGLGFVTAFLGTMAAGAIPVPVYPLGFGDAETASGVVADCAPALAWTDDAESAEQLSRVLGVPAEFAAGDPVEPGPVGASNVAFLQYTSGSTARPRGVVVTHGNLVGNLRAIATAFGHDDTARIVSWLPLYHDMGLIGNVLHPLYSGAEVFLTSPVSLVTDPLGWLRAVARHRADTSGGPNFAYALVARAVAKHGLPNVDLGCWRTAYCGAEPIDPEVLARFAELLRPAGFDAAALLTCYGLAEATLLVTASTPGAGMRTAGGAGLVSSGRPVDCEIRITDESGAPVADGTVGEVRVRGAAVATRYWSPPGSPSRELLDADGWLRTGDLGLLDGGELMVRGRRADTLVLRGRNLYAQDVERLAERVITTARRGCTVALSERPQSVSVVVEQSASGEVVEADFHALAREMSRVHGTAPARLVVVAKGAVPKTTSGKLQRRRCARLLSDGALVPLRVFPEREPEAGTGRAAPAPSELKRVALVLAEVPGVEDYDVPLTAYGLDSLGAIRLAAELERAGYDTVSARSLLEGATLRDILRLTQHPGRTGSPDLDEPASPTGDRPLSTTQESLAFLQMFEPESGAYNIAFACDAPAGERRAEFDAALVRAIRADPELCTTIVRTPNGLARRPVADAALDDACGRPPRAVVDLDEELTRLAEEPFALDGDVLFRLERLTTDRGLVVVLVAHHVVTDLWSLSSLVERAAAPAETYAPVPGYDAYIRAQQEYLESPRARSRDETLRKRFAGVRALDLAVAPEPAGGSADRATVRGSLSPDTFRRLREGSAVARLAAVWGLCLRRFASDGPIAIGMPVAGRSAPGCARLPGVCANTVPLLVPDAPDQDFATVVADVRRQVLDALDAPFYPLSRAVAACRPERVPGRLPLVEAMFTFNEDASREVDGLTQAMSRTTPTDIRCGDLVLRTVPIRRTSSRYDLDLVVTPDGDGCAVELAYRPRRIGPRAASALVDTFVAMVDASVAGDAPAVRDLAVLSARDTQALRRFGLGTATEADGDLWRLLARHDPAAPAVESAHETLDYRTLRRRMDAVAAYVRQCAAAPDGTARPRPSAALLLTEPADVAVAMLGCWRAGYGIVPLPVDHPEARLAFMLSDARPGIVLTDAALRSTATALCEPLGVPTALLAEAVATPGRPAGEEPRDGLAYRLYTSGTTGTPKAVDIRLRQLFPLLAWSVANLGCGTRTRLAQTLSLGFDFGLQEIFTTFALGGCLVIPTPSDRRNGATYAEFLVRERVDTLFATPSFADALVAAGRRLPGLESVLLGGEVLRRETAECLRRLAGPGCRLFNGYGPTEATVNCLMHEYTGGTGDVVPVGAASGTSVIGVVDPHGTAVPARVVGELVVAGAGVADDYVDNARSFERGFVEPAATGGRHYPTGDRAYFDAEDGFTVVGRTDTQRKVRGFRVDLREVETVTKEILPRHGVVVRTAGPANDLVVFLRGDVVDLNDLRARLARVLPAPVVPARYVLLDEFPTTVNGKLDEASLEAAADAEIRLEPIGDARPEQMADLVCHAWAAVLDREPHRAENVFDAGAHSLSAATVHARLCDALRLDFPMLLLFEHPRPADLAAALQELLDRARAGRA